MVHFSKEIPKFRFKKIVKSTKQFYAAHAFTRSGLSTGVFTIEVPNLNITFTIIITNNNNKPTSCAPFSPINSPLAAKCLPFITAKVTKAITKSSGNAGDP